MTNDNIIPEGVLQFERTISFKVTTTFLKKHTNFLTIDEFNSQGKEFGVKILEKSSKIKVKSNQKLKPFDDFWKLYTTFDSFQDFIDFLNNKKKSITLLPSFWLDSDFVASSYLAPKDIKAYCIQCSALHHFKEKKEIKKCKCGSSTFSIKDTYNFNSLAKVVEKSIRHLTKKS